MSEATQSAATDPIDPAIRGEVASLTQNLVKAMNQSSYYDPDHPAAQDVTDEPFNQLKALRGRIGEVTYGLWGGTDNDQLALEGVFEKGMLLSDVLGNSSPYLEKLGDYFQRNQIISLTVKADISQDEFNRFIHVFVQQNRQRDGDDDDSQLSNALKAERIVHVSLLVWSDLVGGRDLAWPVRIVLSRLCKDISVIPLYAAANNQDLSEAKTLLVGDMVRPLRRADLVKELLLNCDLVADTVNEWTLDEVEAAITASLSFEMMEATCWELVDEIVGRSGVINLGSAATRALNHMYPLLAAANNTGTYELFRRLLELEFVTFSDLPKGLQKEIKVEEWTDAYEEDPEGHFDQFNSPPSPDRYHELLKIFVSIFPEFLSRNLPESARRIIEGVHSHAAKAGSNAALRALMAKAIRRLRSEDNIGPAMALLENSKPHQREDTRAVLRLMGQRVIEELLTTLRSHESRSVRRECCTILGEMGQSALDPVIAALSDANAEWYFQRNLCAVLGSLKKTEGIRLLSQFARHPNPKIRLEALMALGQINSPGVEAVLLNALNDEESIVQRRALKILSSLNSSHPQLAAFVADCLALRKNAAEEPHRDLQVAAVATAKRLGNIPIPNHGTMLQVLMPLLAASEQSTVMRKLKGGFLTKNDAIRAAACAALAAFDGDASAAALNDALLDKSERVRSAAERALQNKSA